MIDSIHDKIDTVAVGTAAATAVEQVHSTPLPDVIKTVVQILVGIVTLWHLFSKKKTDTTTTTENNG